MHHARHRNRALPDPVSRRLPTSRPPSRPCDAVSRRRCFLFCKPFFLARASQRRAGHTQHTLKNGIFPHGGSLERTKAVVVHCRLELLVGSDKTFRKVFSKVAAL